MSEITYFENIKKFVEGEQGYFAPDTQTKQTLFKGLRITILAGAAIVGIVAAAVACVPLGIGVSIHQCITGIGRDIKQHKNLAKPLPLYKLIINILLRPTFGLILDIAIYTLLAIPDIILTLMAQLHRSTLSDNDKLQFIENRAAPPA